MSAGHPSTGRKRLDSWKEIAAFFGRDERTVNRWEKDLGLPVHRLPGIKGRVYAYTEELSAWSAAPKNAGAALPGYDSEGQSGLGQPGLRSSGLTIIAGRHVSVEGGSLESASGEEVRAPSAGRYRNTIRLLAVAILGLGALALVLFLPGANRSSKTAGQAASLPRQASPSGVMLASTPSHDPEAEQFYLKGRY